MPTEDLTLFQAINTKTKWLNKRQQLLSQNIANADTPDYRPSDLKALKFKDVLRSSSSSLSMDTNRNNTPGVSKTNASHIGNSPIGDAARRASEAREQRKTYEVAPADNAVVIEEQLLKANETATDHRLMLNLYQKNVNLLRTALGNN